MHDAHQPLTQQSTLIRPEAAVPSSGTGARALLTPRAVERRHPRLSRRVLAQNRALGLPPQYEVVSGCIMYDVAEIERFLASPAAVSCAIYGRADALPDPSDAIVGQVEACEGYIRQTGWTRVHTCVEFGPPSRPRALRRGFQQLLDEAVRGEFDMLVVYDLSHISPIVVDQRRFIRQFKQASVQIVAVQQRRISTDLPIQLPSREEENRDEHVI
jgi:hypothetical protein